MKNKVWPLLLALCSALPLEASNATAVAIALKALAPKAKGDLAAVIADLDTLHGSTLTDSLKQLQLALYNGLALTQENTSTRVRLAMSRRLDQLYLTRCNRECQNGMELNPWIDGLGDYALQKRAQGHSGFRATGGGIILGFDVSCLDHFDVGASFTYTHTGIQWNGITGNGTIDSYYGAAYSNFTYDHFYANAVAIGAYNHYQAQRTILFPGISRTAKNKHAGHEFEGNLEFGGYFTELGVEIRPFYSFDYLELHEDAFTERGAQSLDLTARSRSSTLFRNEVGVGLAHCFRFTGWRIIPDLKFSWIRENRFYGRHYRVEFSGTDHFFTVSGMKPNRSFFSPAAGLTSYLLDDRLSIALLYEGEFSKSFRDQNGNIRAGYSF